MVLAAVHTSARVTHRSPPLLRLVLGLRGRRRAGRRQAAFREGAPATLEPRPLAADRRRAAPSRVSGLRVPDARDRAGALRAGLRDRGAAAFRPRHAGTRSRGDERVSRCARRGRGNPSRGRSDAVGRTAHVPRGARRAVPGATQPALRLHAAARRRGGRPSRRARGRGHRGTRSRGRAARALSLRLVGAQHPTARRPAHRELRLGFPRCLQGVRGCRERCGDLALDWRAGRPCCTGTRRDRRYLDAYLEAAGPDEHRRRCGRSLRAWRVAAMGEALWLLAYTARCEHAIEARFSDERPRRARDTLVRHRTAFLAALEA